MPSDDELINAARRLHQRDGELEIDPPGTPLPESRVSRGAEPGAYVLAWVWVGNGDVEPSDTPACQCHSNGMPWAGCRIHGGTT